MIRTTTFTLALSLFVATAWSLGLTNSVSAQQSVKVFHKTVKVGDLDIFYREAGQKDAPTILLLHGFPTSSQMFRNRVVVAQMTRSTSAADSLAHANALSAAFTHIEDVVSPGPAICRWQMPVRVRIHSSLVSTSASRSWLVTMRSGTYDPQPVIAVWRCTGSPLLGKPPPATRRKRAASAWPSGPIPPLR